MLRVGGVHAESEIRCARRSSAALRTALQKKSDPRKRSKTVWHCFVIYRPHTNYL